MNTTCDQTPHSSPRYGNPEGRKSRDDVIADHALESPCEYKKGMNDSEPWKKKMAAATRPTTREVNSITPSVITRTSIDMVESMKRILFAIAGLSPRYSRLPAWK